MCPNALPGIKAGALITGAVVVAIVSANGFSAEYLSPKAITALVMRLAATSVISCAFIHRASNSHGADARLCAATPRSFAGMIDRAS